MQNFSGIYMYILCIHLTLHVYKEIMTSCDEQGKILTGIRKTGKTYCILML